MPTTTHKLRKEVIDIVFPKMSEAEIFEWVEKDFEGFWKEWRKQPGTAASLELITELQALYPEKITTEAVRAINVPSYKRVVTPIAEPLAAEIPLAEEEIPTRVFTPEEIAQFPATVTEEGWEFSNIKWSEAGEPVDYVAVSPTGEQYTMAELDLAEIRQEDYELLYKEYQRTGGEMVFEEWMEAGAPLRPRMEAPEVRVEGIITAVFPDKTLEEFAEYVESDWEGFLDDMQMGGYTEDKAELLRLMGNSPEEVDAFYEVTEPALQAIPPEGIVYTVKDEKGNDIELHMLEDFEYVGTERTLRSKDYIVYHQGQEVGRITYGTGEFVPYEPTFLEKVGAVAITTLQYALYPFTLSGMGWNRISRLIGGEMPSPKESEEWLRGEWLPGGTEYAKYMELPFWQRLGYEAPAWVALGALGITAIKGRAVLAPLAARPGLVGVAPKIARAALYPIAGYEHAVGLGLKYTIAVPLKLTITGVTKATNVALEKALSGRLGYWLALQGSRGEHANKIVQFFLTRNHAWLHRRAQEAISKRMAQGITAEQATNMAASDVMNDAIPLLLEAAKSVTGKELVPIVSGGLAPSVYTAIQGASPALISALSGLTDKLITGEIAIAQITPEYITSQIAIGLEKTASLVTQLEEMGHTLEAISAMSNEEAWANLFKATVPEVAPPTVPPEIPAVKPPTIPEAVKPALVPEEVPAVPEVEAMAKEVIPILEDVISKQSKTSWHGQRIRADLEQGIWALNEGSIDGAIATIEETLGRPRIPQTHIESLNKALAILQQPKPPAVEVAKPPVEEVAPEVREAYKAQAEIEGLEATLVSHPARDLIGIIKRTGKMKGELPNLTLKQYRDLTGKETIQPNILTADKKHVKWEYALDELASERGYESGEALREGILEARSMMNEIESLRVKALEAEIPVARAEIEAPIEIRPEVEIQEKLTAVQKIRRQYQDKIKTYDQTKKALVDYVNKNLPLAVRGKMLASVKNVKTELGLTKAVNRVNILAEQNAQKELRTEIRKEIKKAQAKVKQHILTGKFTPEVQERLDVITYNLDTRRDIAREKMADNIRKYDDGVLSYEEMLKANEALNFAGIDGMSAEELANTLEYIKILETIGRSERQAKQAVATERINAIRTDIINILTGEKGLKTGVGVVPRAQLAAKPGWLDTFVNWQYSLDNLADKLSKLDPASAPYQSAINKFVAQAHRATNRQAVATRESYNKIKEAIKEVYGVKSTRDINQVLNGLNEEVNLGTFELTAAYKAAHPEATTIQIKMTRDEMIAKYMQMQDSTLNNTFETGMGWSQQVRDTIDNTLTENEKKLSQKIFDIYEEYYPTINEIYRELYNVDMPHNPKYSPIRRDLEGNITENVLTFQDAHQYASVINGSLKARQRNIRPLRFNGATRVLSNHIDQMEHFKAWATTMRDFRRVFGNTQVRQAIEQYHGRGIGKLLDTFISQMARGGIETAATNRVADYLRRAFTKSILAIKPVIGLKQIPSLFAYLSEMKATEFFGGIANFWKSPISNFQFLYKNSEGFRARISQGFTRDIRAARERHGVNRISGRGSFTDWFLLQIRFGDTMAVTQGMWAKYQVGLKAGLSQADAIAAAEDTTNRTQPSFGIDTLSALQNGGSFLKLMTMFQNQPNKYFRLVGDNLRNFKYGRGSRAKAASTILLVWVVLPMMFQYIADAFQWKPERQLRAGLLGPLNYILIGGQLVQTAWGWVTDQPFDYQASPVLSTIDEIQKAIFKAKSMVDKGQDPYKDVSGEDIALLIEYLAKAGGQVAGLPTPFLVQVERGIRTKLKEGEDIDIKDFLFSQWALKTPTKDAGEQVEEASLKLGEVREGEEDKPLTEREPKIYTTVDWFREIGNVYSKVLPQDVLDDPNASKESKAWAEYEIARSQADILPNVSLHKINTEDNDDTIIELYQQWKARERIDNLPDLIEFDTLYPKAYLGNVTRQQYNLLAKYLEADDKDAFLDNHPNLRINPRNEWLKANPLGNARLALAGQAKIYSLEAYNEFNKLVKELDIPDDAIPEFTLPPEGSIETHFEYEEMVSEGKHASWEAQLLLLKDAEVAKEAGVQSYADWHNLTLSDTPVKALELKIKHRDAYDLEKEYSDKDNPLYIEDTDDRKAKLIELLGEKKYQEWVDDMRRIEAYENEATSEDIVGKWVERGNKVDEFGSSSSEAILWLVDNPDVYDWAVENELLEDNREENRAREPILRINVDYAKEDDWYNEGIPDRHKAIDYKTRDHRDAAIAEERARYLAGKEEYNKIRYRREALGLKDKDFNPFPDELIDTYIDYYTNPDLKKPDDWDENLAWYEDDWFLQDHPDFHQALVVYGKFTELRDLSKVPTREVFALYQEYSGIVNEKGDPDAQGRLNFRHNNPGLETWLVETKDMKPVGDRWTAPHDPKLEYRKYWLEQARRYRDLLKLLGIREDITPEELTDAQAREIEKKILALY